MELVIEIEFVIVGVIEILPEIDGLELAEGGGGGGDILPELDVDGVVDGVGVVDRV